MQTGRPCSRARPHFGERLHTLREEKGLTQSQVAKALGISARAYAFWERETVAVRAEQLTVLSKLFGVSLDSLIGQEPPKQRGTGPSGKMRQLFESASRLSRSQQQKVAAVLEPFIKQHTATAKAS